MSDLMREEFEQAAIEILVAEGYSVRSAVEVMERGSDGEYRSVRFNGAWWGWQASREFLVIDLPKKRYEWRADYVGIQEDSDGRLVDIDNVCELIHVAGIKTNPPT